ncbi:hypothetical protein CR513_18936, partial [Mucuna pruriens]
MAKRWDESKADPTWPPGRFVQDRDERTHANRREARKEAEDGQQQNDQDNMRKEEKRRERSRSRPRSNTWHRGTITTILGGSARTTRAASASRKWTKEVLTVQVGSSIAQLPIITFNEKDMRYAPPQQDEPMVVSMIMAEYKVEKVLIDQGSSANILYWLTYKKLGLSVSNLKECSGTLYGFAGEQVGIQGVIELETTFGVGSHSRSIPVLYTVVDYPIGKEVGIVWADQGIARRCYKDSLRIGSQPFRERKPTVNILDLDLDPQHQLKHGRPLPIRVLKEVQIGPLASHKTKIGMVLEKEEEDCLTLFLSKNKDIFAWSPTDMPSIDPNFMCHHLSITPGSRLIAQRKQKLGEEK